MRARTPSLALSVMLLAALACALPSTPGPPDSDGVATAVAATLTAAAPGAPPGDETQPAATPAASPTPSPPPVLRIVYQNADNLWLIEGANPPVQITSHGDTAIWQIGDLVISSDGQKIAYARFSSTSEGAELWSVNRDGSGNTLLFNTSQFDTLYPLEDSLHYVPLDMAFIPGTHTLLLNTKAVFNGPGLFKNDDLLQVNLDGGGLTPMLPRGSGGDFLPSPDGSQIAIIRADSISLMNSDGSNLRPNLVAYAPVMTYSEYAYYAQPVWAPDSTALGVLIPSADPLAAGTGGTVWRIPADGSAPAILGNVVGQTFFPQVFGAPGMAPDLAHIAFLREGTTPGPQQLIIANADGSGEVIYETGPRVNWQGWGPDGQRFIYGYGDPSVLRTGALGAAPAPVGPGRLPRWISDTEFLYLSGSASSWTIMRGSVGGGAPTPLVSPAGSFINFDFAN